jgi:hypothetical protein
MYAVNLLGNREVCPHPGEKRRVQKITKLSFGDAKQRGLVGTISYCVCLNCLSQQNFDLENDRLICGNCGSNEIISEKSLVGRKCPKCHEGDFEEIETKVWA